MKSEMRCIFCKRDSSLSRSREHIIPESLGNSEHLLPPGVVCDGCNNYFARKVEKQFLESPALTVLRFQEGISNKRGLVPMVNGIIPPNWPVKCSRNDAGELEIYIDDRHAAAEIARLSSGKLIIPASGPPPDNLVVSRFLAKAGLEALAARLVGHIDLLEEFVDEPQLDALRGHARKAIEPNWPFSRRQIYNADQSWSDGSLQFQVVHEFDLLQTETNEWYFVLALFGMEFVINLGGPSIEGYEKWLSEHGSASPLYVARNSLSDVDRRDTGSPDSNAWWRNG